jgi:hypothetical protein
MVRSQCLHPSSTEDAAPRPHGFVKAEPRSDSPSPTEDDLFSESLEDFLCKTEGPDFSSAEGPDFSSAEAPDFSSTEGQARLFTSQPVDTHAEQEYKDTIAKLTDKL